MFNIDAVILCGGLGTRLNPVVSDRAKPMSEINGKPFLDIIVNHLVSYGIKRIVFCLGHKADTIKRYYQENTEPPLEIVFSYEQDLLGTAGAIKNAQNYIKTSPFLVLNGDSFCKVNLNDFYSFYQNNHAEDAMVLSKKDNVCDYGSVFVNKDNTIRGFKEKSFQENKGLVNAGVYLLSKKFFSLLKTLEVSSLEKDIFPKLVGKDFYGFITQENFIDIGTPQRYEQAKKELI